MRRAVRKFYKGVSTLGKSQHSRPLAWFSSASDSNEPEGKEKSMPSAPITQLFKELNVNVKNSRPQSSRPRLPPGPRTGLGNSAGPRPGPTRQGQPPSRVTNTWQEEDKAWARPRPQNRVRRETSTQPGEDEYGLGTQQRPRQRAPSRQGKPRREGTGGSVQGAGQRALAPRKRKSSGSAQRDSKARERGREARMLADAPKHIQDLAAEEEIFQLKEGEPMALINKQTGARIRSSAEMPIRQKQLQDDWDRAAVMEIDPTVNINWGAPVRLPRYTAEKLFEDQAPQLREALGIESDQEWQETKHQHLQEVKASMDAQKAMLGVRDEKADEAVLFAMRDSVPPNHAMKHHVNMVVHQLARNPGWDFRHKHRYMTKLLHEYVHKRH